MTIPISSARRRLLRCAWLTGGVLAVDQAVKAATSHAAAGRWLYPVHNPGLSLGVVDTARWSEVAAMAVGLLVATVALGAALRAGRVRAAPAALVLGGAASNLLDRALTGSVRDMLAVGPIVINPADVAVVAGVLLLAGAETRRLLRSGAGAPTWHACVSGPGRGALEAEGGEPR